MLYYNYTMKIKFYNLVSKKFNWKCIKDMLCAKPHIPWTYTKFYRYGKIKMIHNTILT